jgi:hypothetical protein
MHLVVRQRASQINRKQVRRVHGQYKGKGKFFPVRTMKDLRVARG